MTDRTDAADERHEQALPASALSPDISFPLTTVEPEQRGGQASEATRFDGVPLAVLGPVPPRPR
ncbi:MAG: hypothetical protein ACRDUV_01195 [Pseudonocardiaceae bacterium]